MSCWEKVEVAHACGATAVGHGTLGISWFAALVKSVRRWAPQP